LDHQSPAASIAPTVGVSLRHTGRVIDVDEEHFGELVEAALASIPDELRRRMRNVAIAVEDEGASPSLLGLYHGVPLTARTTAYGGVLPDRITIYRLPILRRCRTVDDVVRQVRITVVHEVAHHFGIDDERLHELGWA
jgi:predicted Zn-dependent protease with MMP-like domain